MSLIAHSQLGDGLETDIGHRESSFLIEAVVADYAAAEWNVPEDFMTFQHFTRVVENLDWSSSPGYPYLLTYSTNALMFQVVDGKPSIEALTRVWGLVSQRLLNRDADPVRLFVKPEPHKQSKLDSHRYRLISSVSVIDQIVDHMIFGDFNKAVINNYMMLPSKVGWSPYKGGWKIVPAFRMIATDKTAWDWTVKEWLVNSEFEVRRELCRTRGELYRDWINLAAWRYKKLYYDNVFVTSGGHMLRQKEPGVVKSGCVNTIVTNSIMQSIIHHRACMDIGEMPRPLWSMGDDTLQYPQRDMQKYLEALSRYCLVKESSNKTEFAGNSFETGGIIEPLYHAKHCFNLLHVDPNLKSDIALAYSLLYHRSRKKRIMEEILTQLGRLPSDSILDMIVDGE